MSLPSESFLHSFSIPLMLEYWGFCLWSSPFISACLLPVSSLLLPCRNDCECGEDFPFQTAFTSNGFLDISFWIDLQNGKLIISKQDLMSFLNLCCLFPYLSHFFGHHLPKIANHKPWSYLLSLFPHLISYSILCLWHPHHHALNLDYNSLVTCLSVRSPPLQCPFCSKVIWNQFIAENTFCTSQSPSKPSRPSWNVEELAAPHLCLCYTRFLFRAQPPSEWKVFKGFVLVISEPGLGPGCQEVLMNVCWTNCWR